MPNNVKTYDGTGDLEDHVKNFQAAARVERCAMPTWCHMFNSTIIGAARVWFDELPSESIDGYKDLKAAFLAYFMQQNKRMKGAPECMRISGFMHRVNNPELTKRLNEHVPKTMEEMMIATTAFIRGEAAAAGKKKGHTSWRAQDQSKRNASERRSDFRGQPREGRGSSRMTRQKVTQSFERVSEITFPSLTTSSGTEGPLVIEAEIGGHMIHRMYVDGGSSTEVLYEHCFNRLRPEIKNQMVPATTSLTGFSGETIWPLGQLRLLVTIGDADHFTKAWMNFMIVRSLSPYNGIIGRPGIREIQAVPSTAHGMLKFPVDGGIVTIRSTILIPAECATVITSSKEIPKEAGVRHENFKVALHPNFPDQEVAIGGTLSAKGRTELCSLLKKNLDIFAWQPSDMTGVPRSIAEHRLNIREGYSPVRQKKRGQAPERAKAIQIEVQKLVEAGIMREVYYHEWLSNPVMVKKHDGSWRMCVDFTDLNKACPQDCYPLPEIDWKVESLCGYPFKCFLDAYKGYHQIQMAESDEEKTAFHTSHGVYCYTKMPFGLKNAGATYQRLVDKAFDNQVGQNIEVYVDDLVIKSHTEAEMLRDIDEMFRTLRKINMKLNPKKCMFGAVEGMFLGYMISPKGIKQCPNKTKAVLQLPSLRTIKEVQSLNGELASLNRFLSKPAEKSLPLFKTLKKCIKKSDFHWTPDAKQAFKQLKQHLSELPLVVAPKPKEELIVYLSASHEAISAVLMTERGTVQTSVYFFTTSNNEAEYEALKAGLQIAAQMGVRNVHISVDSKLVANQVLGAYVAKEENMIKYLEKVKSLVLVEILKEKSIQEKEVTIVVEEEGPTWITPIIEYLKDGTLPDDRKEASKLSNYVIREIHEGSCNMHAAPRSMVAKAMGLGYYWSIIHRDTRDMIRTCNDCQIHRPVPRNPQEPLTPITAPWLFYKWGINIAGPFPEGPGKIKFLIVAMDDFTKWIEAKVVATITGNQVKKFVWDNIVCHFGLLREIVSYNGKQFSDNPFKDWCEKLNITQRFALVKHPQSNRLVERENRSLGEGIKARLGKGNKNWIKELSHVF
ncbi:reverse transcriptase domain-containing protein [Tanacetum coccineum]